MSTLIFFIAVLAILILAAIASVNAFRRKPAFPAIKKMGLIIIAYAVIWAFFYRQAKLVTVPFGTEDCFDDWCATITNAEYTPVHKFLPAAGKDSVWVVLSATMLNHARGIAQSPSEPRVHIIDNQGNYWAFSAKAQQMFNAASGQQASIRSRLEIGQPLTTKIVFKVPVSATSLRALIEEGPFITQLLFPDDKMVFRIK